MKPVCRKYNGSVTVEYLIVALLLMIPLWYAFVGGSGVWNDPDKVANNGNLSKGPVPAEPYPGLLQVLDDHQHEFSQKLNEP